jgi:hypothetical protein
MPIAVEVSLDQHGTRTIQSIVEALFSRITEKGTMHEELHRIINQLSPEALTLCTDVHGNHVI